MNRQPWHDTAGQPFKANAYHAGKFGEDQLRDQSAASGLPDIRFGDSFAEAHIHGLLLVDDYEKRSQYRPCSENCQPTKVAE